MLMKRKTRESGILMPLTSLPSPYGVGTLGKEAYAFIDFLAEAEVDIWQLLPLNVTSYGDSPYQSPSANGLNYYLIDLDTLVKKGLLKKEEIESVDFGSDPNRVDYGLLFNNRVPLLKKAFARFDKKSSSFRSFVKEGKYNDFAFFMTMKSLHSFAPWYEWGEKGSVYSPLLEKRVILENQDLYLFYVWTQYEFLKEYQELKSYAHKKNIRLMGDMPLYLAYDSIEAYKYPELFCFDENHRPTLVAGVPPDYFNADGQLWGNPIYNWEKMKEDGYSWWNKRIENNLELFDILRIDHFRGLSAYYTIPVGRKNARVGEWMKGPGMDLFDGKKDLPIVAEDLGFIDDDVKELLAETGYPGMKVLEFAFDGDKENEHKPSNSLYNYICYTGTHDNDPLAGYLSSLGEKEKAKFKEDVKKECSLFAVPYDDKDDVALTHTVDSLAFASPCRLTILPYADVLALGSEARINTPALMNGRNWTYRYTKKDFSRSVIRFLKENIEKYR